MFFALSSGIFAPSDAALSTPADYRQVFQNLPSETPLGLTEAEFRTRRPEAAVLPRMGALNDGTTIYTASLTTPDWSESNLTYRFHNGTLATVMLSEMDISSKLVVTEKLAWLGRSIVAEMERQWGKPYSREAFRHSMGRGHSTTSVSLKWRAGASYIEANMPSAADLLSGAGRDKDPSLYFGLGVSTSPWATQCEARRGCEPTPFIPALLEFDASTYYNEATPVGTACTSGMDRARNNNLPSSLREPRTP